MDFNGEILKRESDKQVLMHQERNIGRLDAPENDKAFSSKRAMAQYVRMNCRPEIWAPVQPITHGSEATIKREYRMLGRLIDHLKKNPDSRLRYVLHDVITIKLVLFTDT